MARCVVALVDFRSDHSTLIASWFGSQRLAWSVRTSRGLRTMEKLSLVGEVVRGLSRKRRRERGGICLFQDVALVQEVLINPMLEGFDAVVVDDFEERGAFTDVLVSFVRKVFVKREDFRVVVVTATERAAEVAAEGFKRRGMESEAVRVADLRRERKDTVGRVVRYCKAPCHNFVSECAQVVSNIHNGTQTQDGNIVVFLPSEETVLECIQLLQSKPRFNSLNIYKWVESNKGSPLHARPASLGTRNCIVISSILESRQSCPEGSFHNVQFVVDSMHTRRTSYSAQNGQTIKSAVVPITKEEAEVRGLLSQGQIIRLCTESDYARNIEDSIPPELQRLEISSVVLQLKALHVSDVVHFDFVSPPPAESMIKALDLLHAIGAVDGNGTITSPDGENMSRMLPIHPTYSKLLLVSLENGCAEEALTIVSFLTVLQTHRSIFKSEQSETKSKRTAITQSVLSCVSALSSKEGDLIFFVNLYRMWMEMSNNKRRQWSEANAINFFLVEEACSLRTKIEKRLRSIADKNRTQLVSCCDDVETLQKCICAAFFMNAAQLSRDGRTYKCLTEICEMKLHPSSVFAKLGGMPPGWIVVPELSNAVSYVTKISPDWLVELAPHVFQSRDAHSETEETEQQSLLERVDAYVRDEQERKNQEPPEPSLDTFLDNVEF